MAYGHARYFTDLTREKLEINKEVVLDSLRASRLIDCWVAGRQSERRGPGHRAFTAEEELEIWVLFETLSGEQISGYDQIDDPESLASVMAGLSLALLLSSDNAECFAIRREWRKISYWLTEHYGIEVESPGTSLIEASSQWLLSRGGGLEMVAEYLPELKQGWSSGGAEGVRDYLTVIDLREKQKAKPDEQATRD